MAKIKLTKNELKKKKDSLKMYKRYLPTLQLKKQQLQMEIRGVEARLSQLEEAKQSLERQFSSWVAVFAEEGSARGDSGIPLLSLKAIRTSVGNIAGVVIPVFESAEFELADYDYFITPLWVDKALELIKQVLVADAEFQVVEKQRDLLSAELRITTQRVNLFEKVKIPETLADIKRIGIYLGDQQTAQVVRG
ncbi:MAG TPA: V-type ATP synthase subunit D, partial [Rectinemataceae bacterium]|nr:V-type ATP synthase subunit D [Rectinemataceae bacterium]